MNTPRDDFDLDALLRQPTERLTPPDGSWEQITRRANRRKWMKASVSVAAGVLIIAGAVPAVIAVQHSHTGGNQTIQVAQSPIVSGVPRPLTSKAPSVGPVVSTSPAPAVPAALAGFVPTSLSFVGQAEGFLWGHIGSSHQGVLAHTTDGGTSWTQLAAPPVNDAAGVNGDQQMRFGHPLDGFVYGASYYATLDGGLTWQQYPSHGYIDDLEVQNGVVWALVRPTRDSKTVTLWQATTGDPTLVRVTAVRPMTSLGGADSIAVNSGSVDVIAGSTDFWTSRNGVKWHQNQNPCLPTLNGGAVQSALLTTLNLPTVIAACGYNISGGTEDKRIFVSTDGGKQWTAPAGVPAGGGYLETFAAGTKAHWIIGTSRAGAQITTNGGKTWTPDTANGVPLGFVGFIDLHHIVGIADRGDATQGAFATSYDSGRGWTVTGFGK